jgi:hypothetical protein
MKRHRPEEPARMPRDSETNSRSRRGGKFDVRPDRVEDSDDSSNGTLTALQRRHGNRAVQRFVESGAGDAAAGLAPADGPTEREAERTAEAVAGRDRSSGEAGRATEPTVRRKPRPSRTESAKDSQGVPDEVTDVVGSPGRPLESSVQETMEEHFGEDFGGVRIHTGRRAAASAQAVDARAYTVGHNIVFGQREYAPESPAGQRLLAHELAHVVQQRGVERGRSVMPVQRQDDGSGQQQSQRRELPDHVIESVVRETIRSELAAYQNLSIMVGDTEVTVSAWYFNNASPRDFRSQQLRNEFRAVVDSFEDEAGESMIQSALARPRDPGEAVRAGKATPRDLEQFVQRAVNDGRIESYARRRSALADDQQLIDLDAGDLAAVIQQWVGDAEVGVDCSGLVVDMLVRARRNVRGLVDVTNRVQELFGDDVRYHAVFDYTWRETTASRHRADEDLPDIHLPDEPGRTVRSARSYRNEPEVNSPRELAPGDVWVTRGGAHIRIVQRTERVGDSHVRFWTAESTTAGSTTGPTEKVWRTDSLERFQPVQPLEGSVGDTDGTFHRVL